MDKDWSFHKWFTDLLYHVKTSEERGVLIAGKRAMREAYESLDILEAQPQPSPAGEPVTEREQSADSRTNLGQSYRTGTETLVCPECGSVNSCLRKHCWDCEGDLVSGAGEQSSAGEFWNVEDTLRECAREMSSGGESESWPVKPDGWLVIESHSEDGTWDGVASSHGGGNIVWDTEAKPIYVGDAVKEITRLKAELEQANTRIKNMKEMHDFGWQCYQDRCEGAFAEATVVKRIQDQLAQAQAEAAKYKAALERYVDVPAPIYSDEAVATRDLRYIAREALKTEEKK